MNFSIRYDFSFKRHDKLVYQGFDQKPRIRKFNLDFDQYLRLVHINILKFRKNVSNN